LIEITLPADAIFKHNELPRVVLGFMGPSGCGKSSVINALLDYEELLPCNCTEACTAVAVEISWNTSNEKASGNRAVIQFMTAEEWKEELQNLVTVLLSLEPEARLDPVDDDTRIASTKIKNVYPDYDLSTLTEQSVTELMNDSVVAKSLGQNLVIEKPPGKEKQFAAAIAPYIDSSPKAVTVSGRSKKKTPYWPLVKVVKIYTKARVLETGLVLVDLPGSGDANIAREMVAEEYMSQVSAICILADIKRALTNKVAKDLFGRGFALKRRLLRGNLLHEERTFFVLTCTDVINNRQVINQQGLESSPDVRQLLEVQEGIITRRGEIFNETENLNTRNAQRSKIMKDISKNIQASQSRLNKRKRKQPADDMQASPAPGE
jgi:GTPase SAR1 family protein